MASDGSPLWADLTGSSPQQQPTTETRNNQQYSPRNGNKVPGRWRTQYPCGCSIWQAARTRSKQKSPAGGLAEDAEEDTWPPWEEMTPTPTYPQDKDLHKSDRSLVGTNHPVSIFFRQTVPIKNHPPGIILIDWRTHLLQMASIPIPTKSKQTSTSLLQKQTVRKMTDHLCNILFGTQQWP